MLDAKKLLGQFLGTQDTRYRKGYGEGKRPRGQSFGSAGNPLGGGLGQALGSVLGGGGGSQGRGSSFGNSALPGVIAGGLSSYLLKNKRRRGFGGSMGRTGGMALVAGLAYKAWQQYQAQQRAGAAHPAASGFGSPARQGPASANEGRFHPAPDEEDRRARLFLSAMIAAAKADGTIDADEQEAIFGRVDDLDLDAETKGFLMDEMRRPMTIEALVAEAGTEEIATEIYLASLLAIDPDHPAEIAYLERLAAGLRLPPELAAEIRRAADEAADPA